MSGETDLRKLLQSMSPKLNKGEFVFCKVESSQAAKSLDPICIFKEDEGISVIIPRQQADRVALPYSVVCAWITLTVHSSLEAVGLTASVSKALTESNISCNVVAAYFHDHIFVPIADANEAMNVLGKITLGKGI
ncbi:MAG TPA: acetyltransferase [Anaerolineae bacterium]|nr:acetyltransferase [Anaerolineae bacterium]